MCRGLVAMVGSKIVLELAAVDDSAPAPPAAVAFAAASAAAFAFAICCALAKKDGNAEGVLARANLIGGEVRTG